MSSSAIKFVFFSIQNEWNMLNLIVKMYINIFLLIILFIELACNFIRDINNLALNIALSPLDLINKH